MEQGQSKKHSWWEAWANIFVGFSINYVANLLIFPLFGMHISLLDNFWMGIIYTVISLVRSFYLRRTFNWIHLKQHRPRENFGTWRER